jgi:hypothetical protein
MRIALAPEGARGDIQRLRPRSWGLSFQSLDLGNVGATIFYSILFV